SAFIALPTSVYFCHECSSAHCETSRSSTTSIFLTFWCSSAPTCRVSSRGTAESANCNSTTGRHTTTTRLSCSSLNAAGVSLGFMLYIISEIHPQPAGEITDKAASTTSQGEPKRRRLPSWKEPVRSIAEPLGKEDRSEKRAEEYSGDPDVTRAIH